LAPTITATFCADEAEATIRQAATAKKTIPIDRIKELLICRLDKPADSENNELRLAQRSG
jgi:hypothetical protein